MKVIKVIFFVYLINMDCLINTTNLDSKYAIVIDPVVDVVGQLLPDISFYNNIALSPLDKKDALSCFRFHQLLFNETVKIIEEQDYEFVIESPSFFYQQMGNSIKKNRCRILKKKVVLLSHLKKLNIDLAKFPKPIDFNQEKNKTFEKTIVLKEPFEDPITKKIYSAGTRFIYLTEGIEGYKVHIFNRLKNKFIITQIPKNLCLNSYNNVSIQIKIKNFVRLLKKWANLDHGFIPYVWGGSSFCNSYKSDEFIESKKVLKRKELNYFEYPQYKQNPKVGFDCSGMILRAAQICSIPYYFKNSITAAQNMKTIKLSDKISNGDIIWIPGHILVISDVEKNLIVEATDYSTGYGKVHEIPISQLFKDIHNFNDLRNNFFGEKNLKRLNKQSEIFELISDFKILKLSSLW